MNTVTIDTVKTITGDIYIAKIENFDEKYYLVAFTMEQLHADVEKLVMYPTYVISTDEYNMFMAWKHSNFSYQLLDSAGIESICDHYIGKLNAISDQYDEDITDIDSNLVDEYIYIILDHLKYVDGLQTTIVEILANNGIDLSTQHIQYITENISWFAKFETSYYSNVPENYIDSVMFGEIEIDLHDVVPVFVAEKISRKIEIFLDVDSGNVRGYLDYSYNGISACLDIALVREYVYEQWHNSITEFKQFYSSGNGWITLHDSNGDKIATYNFNFDTLIGETPLDEG